MKINISMSLCLFAVFQLITIFGPFTNKVASCPTAESVGDKGVYLYREDVDSMTGIETRSEYFCYEDGTEIFRTVTTSGQNQLLTGYEAKRDSSGNWNISQTTNDALIASLEHCVVEGQGKALYIPFANFQNWPDEESMGHTPGQHSQAQNNTQGQRFSAYSSVMRVDYNNGSPKPREDNQQGGFSVKVVPRPYSSRHVRVITTTDLLLRWHYTKETHEKLSWYSAKDFEIWLQHRWPEFMGKFRCYDDFVLNNFNCYEFNGFLEYIKTFGDVRDSFLLELENQPKILEQMKRFRRIGNFTTHIEHRILNDIMWFFPGITHAIGSHKDKWAFLEWLRNENAQTRAKRQKMAEEKAEQHRIELDKLAQYASMLERLKTRYTQAPDTTDPDMLDRYADRVEAINQTIKDWKKFDYSSKVLHPKFTDFYAKDFDNCYGTHIDKRLHEELCDARLAMLELQADYKNDLRVKMFTPIVFEVTGVAKKDSQIDRAFDYCDFANNVIKIVSSWATFASTKCKRLGDLTDQAMQEAGKTWCSKEHWVNLALAPLKLLIFVVNEDARLDDLTAASFQAAFSGDDSLFMQRADELAEHYQVMGQALEKDLNAIKDMPRGGQYKFVVRNGYLFLLDMVGLKYLELVGSMAGRAIMNDLATLMTSPAADAFAAEVAGIGKVTVEEGADVVNMALDTIEKNPGLLSEGKSITEITQDTVENIIENGFKLDPKIFGNLKAIGENTWETPQGLIYGYDKKFGNTLNHTLAHMAPNPLKRNHTVFCIPKEEVVALIDEAWTIKGVPLPLDSRAYVVDMGKIIGINGETALRIVVKEQGTAEILTAYPVLMKG